MSEHPPFYGKVINRRAEKEYIQSVVQQFKDRPVDEALKKEVWEKLMWEKHLGNVTIPFKLALRKDPQKLYPDHLEVILDSKV
jgi:hypothetical protein